MHLRAQRRVRVAAARVRAVDEGDEREISLQRPREVARSQPHRAAREVVDGGASARGTGVEDGGQRRRRLVPPRRLVLRPQRLVLLPSLLRRSAPSRRSACCIAKSSRSKSDTASRVSTHVEGPSPSVHLVHLVERQRVFSVLQREARAALELDLHPPESPCTATCVQSVPLR